MQNKNVRMLTQSSMIAAIYVVLTALFAPFGFGEVQIRIAEMLVVLPMFTPAAVPGLFAGCLLGNILGGALLPDVIFGSIATLIGAYGTWRLRKFGLPAAVFPPVLANVCIVPLVLRLAYGVVLPLPLLMLTVGLGEAISCIGLGSFLAAVMKKHRGSIRLTVC